MHAFGIVLVKPGDDVAGEVARLLMPFSENSDEYAAQFDEEGNETASYVPGRFWWDWYRIGGRWDGKVRGVEYESAPGCVCAEGSQHDFLSASDCHYRSDRHETLERNVVPVVEMGECRPFTLVTPEGEVRHRRGWIPDESSGRDESWPWRQVDDEGFDRWCGEQMLAHRDCLAVGIDYHD